MFRRSASNNQANRRITDSHRRISGRTGLTVLFEILLIGAVCWTVTELIVSSLNFGSSAAPNRVLGIPLLQLELTSSGQELWMKRGRHEILSFNLKSQETNSVYVTESRPIGTWAVSRDGLTWMHCDEDLVVSIYQNRELIVSHQVIRPGDMISHIHPICLISADGRTAACVVDTMKVSCWDLAKRELVLSEFSLPEPGHKVVMDPAGRLFASTYQGTIQAYDSKTGAVVWTLPGTRPLARPPVFSTDGDWMVVARGNDLERYDTKTQEKFWTIENHQSDAICSLAISGDGKWIAVSRIVDGIRILDASTGNPCGLCFRDSAMHKVVFSTGSNQLFSADPFGSLQVWSLLPSVESKSVSLFD